MYLFGLAPITLTDMHDWWAMRPNDEERRVPEGGVVAVGLTAFAALAMVKKDEKFEREVLLVVDLRQ